MNLGCEECGDDDATDCCCGLNLCGDCLESFHQHHVPASDYGYVFAAETAEDLGALARIRPGLNLDDTSAVELDPRLITYSSQRVLRSDVLSHYMSSSDLFDPDGWYGTNHPVVVKWKGAYLVLDGNHRVLADRLCGRTSRVLLTSASKEGTHV